MRVLGLPWAMACIGAALALPASAAPDGPFGIVMGSDPAAYGCEGPIDDPFESQVEATYVPRYRCTDVPKPHELIDDYIVKAWPGAGICYILAKGPAIEVSPDGHELQRAIREMGDLLTVAYGPPNSPVRVPSDRAAWIENMRSAIGGHGTIWSPTAGNSFRNGVNGIVLAGAFTKAKGFYVSVSFDFENAAACNDPAVAAWKAKADNL